MVLKQRGIKDFCVVLAYLLVQLGFMALVFLAVVNWDLLGEEQSHPPEQTNDPTISTLDPLTPNETTTISDHSPTLPSGNCTTRLGKLMLINYNFPVDTTFIANRKSQLVNLTELYGITEAKSSNGTPLLDAEAATHLNDMLRAYANEHPDHTMQTRSCFRSVGTSCGRLCATTGKSDHHTGYTCDLIDSAYGTELDTSHLPQHLEWQWLKDNSYKYGFIDRYPYHWAGGSMSAPINVGTNGSTGFYETWHYRYVGIPTATDIATGKYNNGAYDSLEHYLKATGQISDLSGCN